MNVSSQTRMAILLHGFAGKTDFMKEIESCLKNDPYNHVYEDVFNISFYSSPHGLDFSKKYDLRTPIYNKNTTETLAHNSLELITSKLHSYEEKMSLDIYAHSMGGLVTRSIVNYLTKKDDQNNIWINNAVLKNIILIGTPNHGTRLAQRFLNIPVDLLLTVLNLVLELPHGIEAEDLQLQKSQFIQMTPNSHFLKKLNQYSNKNKTSVNWITIRGLNSAGLLGIPWQPFLFRKFWINKKFPFLHHGIIPNDGLVEASSVPLKGATNLTVPEATHMDLLRWNTEQSGKKVKKLLDPIINH